MIKEASHQIENCWTTDYSLRTCEGYQVFESNAWLGYVDAVLTDRRGEVHSLLVKAGEVFIAVPLDAVVEIDPAVERIDLAERHEARSLTQ